MKTRLENKIDPLGQDPTKDKTESSRWEPTQQNFLLPVDRQWSDFRPLGKAVDRTVDRSSQTESKTLCRSTRPVDRNKQRALALAADRPDRSTEVQACTLVDRAGRPF